MNIVSGKLSEKQRSLLPLLENKQQYQAMFAKLLNQYAAKAPEVVREKGVKNLTVSINSYIDWARKNLKKNDRIVWFLKIVRATYYLENPELTPEAGPDVTSGFPAATRATLMGKLEHFLSLPIPEIQNYVFGDQPRRTVFVHFEDLEAEWQKTAREWFEDEQSEVVIDCGDDWYWVNTHTAHCHNEAGAMGHCGNSPRRGTEDEIISLRKKKIEHGRTLWRPSLTFILYDGELGEMKGRGNAKPAAKYHSQIMKLLLSPLVIGIKGGGYLPEHNFALEDLTEDEVKAVIKAKPELATCAAWYKYFGVQGIRTVLEADIFSSTHGFIEDVEGDRVLLGTVRYLDALDYKDDSLDSIESVCNDDFYSVDLLSPNMEDVEEDFITTDWLNFLKKYDLYDQVSAAANEGRSESSDENIGTFLFTNVGAARVKNHLDVWRRDARQWAQDIKEHLIKSYISDSDMIDDIVETDGNYYQIWSNVEYIVHALGAYKGFATRNYMDGRGEYKGKYYEFYVCASKSGSGNTNWLRWVRNGCSDRAPPSSTDKYRRFDELEARINEEFGPKLKELVLDGLKRAAR